MFAVFSFEECCESIGFARLMVEGRERMDTQEVIPRSIESLIDAYQASLLRLCYAYLHDWALAEDAVQETFLKAYRHLDDFRGDCAEKTWLMRIAINCCKDVRRSHYFRCVQAVPPEELRKIKSNQATNADVELTMEIMRLPIKLREAVLLCWYQGMSYTEAAQALGITQQAVSSRMDRARRKMQAVLKGSEENDAE